MDMLKIATTPLQDDGCWWYRIKNFARVAKENGLASVEEIKPKYDDKTIEMMFDNCDVFLYRFGTESLAHVVREFKNKYPKKPVILDTDDDLHNLSPINEGYTHFGTNEVVTADGKPLWEDGKANFSLYDNRHRMVDYDYCLERSDLVITTTIRMVNRIKEHNEAAVAIPNCIDFSYWPLLDIKKDRSKVVLVWSGGASHYEDLYTIKSALKTLMDKYPHLHVAIVGQLFGGIRKGLPSSRFIYYPWVKPDGHGYRMACVNADIAFAPLRDMDFNYQKSCIKWYEYSALKLPSVLSNLPPYSDEAQDNQNALLFNTPDEFIEKVSFLIDNPLERIKMGENAYQWTKRNRDIRNIVIDWVEVIRKTVEAKK